MITGLTIIGILTNVSTTSTLLDWILVSGIYLTVSLVLWWTQFQANKALRILGFVSTSAVFSVGYLVGSVGVLGVVFVVGNYAVDSQQWLPNGLIYKESILGNAVSDYRGRKVEIYKTIPWIPIIEWRIKEKEYRNIITYQKKLDVRYSQTTNEIYLSTSMEFGEGIHPEYWSDTLKLE
jgi:hypothetical protein